MVFLAPAATENTTFLVVTEDRADNITGFPYGPADNITGFPYGPAHNIVVG